MFFSTSSRSCCDDGTAEETGSERKGSGKSASDMLPFLMSAAASGKKNGLNFSQNEISAVLEVMKAGKSPQEAAKIDKIVNLMRMIH